MQISEKLSLSSVIIAVSAAGITIAQWWNSDTSEKIKVAVEISRNYPKDHTLDEQSALFAAYSHQGINNKNIIPISKVYDDLEYIAFLSNTGRLDRGYLSKRVLCDLYMAGTIADQFAGTTPDNPRTNSEIGKFGKDQYCQIFISNFVAANGLGINKPPQQK